MRKTKFIALIILIGGFWSTNIFAQSGIDQNRRLDDSWYFSSGLPNTNPFGSSFQGEGMSKGVATKVAWGVGWYVIPTVISDID